MMDMRKYTVYQFVMDSIERGHVDQYEFVDTDANAFSMKFNIRIKHEWYSIHIFDSKGEDSWLGKD